MTRSLYPGFGVLLVDDEVSFLRSLSLMLERSCGITNLYRCEDSRLVLKMLAEHNIRLVLLDLTMPNVSGEDVLKSISEQFPEVAVIVISGMNQVETAVKCIKLGAQDYYVKTVEEDRIVKGIKRVIHILELHQENLQLREKFLSDDLEHPEVFARVRTGSKSMRSVFQYLELVAPSPQPVMISGESGVGKELIAAALHTLSGRSGPLVAVNIAGLDDNVFSDTLFGHEKGAFTGADKRRPGMIEKAAGGTLFLDEIGDLNAASQVKLLRLLQEGEYYPLGSDRAKHLRARIIVATHQDLRKRQASNEFRKDLFYRLRTHHVHIPALRERRKDIPLLLDYFLGEAAAEQNKKCPSYPPELSILLMNYAFPGNVRELKSMVYDAVSIHKSRMLSMAPFKRAIDTQVDLSGSDVMTQEVSVFAPNTPLPALHEVTDLLVLEAMQRAESNQTIAARLLSISQPALSKRLKKMGRREGFVAKNTVS